MTLSKIVLWVLPLVAVIGIPILVGRVKYFPQTGKGRDWNDNPELRASSPFERISKVLSQSKSQGPHHAGTVIAEPETGRIIISSRSPLSGSLVFPKRIMPIE